VGDSISEYKVNLVVNGKVSSSSKVVRAFLGRCHKSMFHYASTPLRYKKVEKEPLQDLKFFSFRYYLIIS
jgi:hypothetical protein